MKTDTLTVDLNMPHRVVQSIPAGALRLVGPVPRTLLYQPSETITHRTATPSWRPHGSSPRAGSGPPSPVLLVNRKNRHFA